MVNNNVCSILNVAGVLRYIHEVEIGGGRNFVLATGSYGESFSVLLRLCLTRGPGIALYMSSIGSFCFLLISLYFHFTSKYSRKPVSTETQVQSHVGASASVTLSNCSIRMSCRVYLTRLKRITLARLEA